MRRARLVGHKITPPDPAAAIRRADEYSKSANEWLRAEGHFAGRDLGPLELEHFYADGLVGTHLNLLRQAYAVRESGGTDAFAGIQLGILAERLGLAPLITIAEKAVEAGKNRARGRQDTAEETRAKIRKEFDDLRTPKTSGAVIAAAKLIHGNHPAAPGEKNGYGYGTVLNVLRKYVREGPPQLHPAEKIPSDS